MAKILITGGTGFIGTELARVLKKNHEVVAVGRNIKNIKNPVSGVKYVECDVRNPSEVKKIVSGMDYVYHLAALLDESLPKDLLFDVNVEGTLNVLEAFKESGGKRLIYLSTVGVMGETERVSNETSPYRPKTNYEKSKTMAERMVKEYHRRHKLPVIILRSALVYGPNEYTLKILKKAKKLFPILGSGKNKVHFVYIKNLIDALVKAKSKGKDGEVYIIADNKPCTYEDFYRILREELGVKGEPSHIPVWLGKLLSLLYKILGRRTIVTSEHIDRLIRNRRYSIKKAKKELGYKPKYDLRSGIRETVKYFKKKGFL